MYSPVTTLIDRIDSSHLSDYGVIPWSAPVPFFGDIETAELATVGINPSNREFLDAAGGELDGEQRRLPTLRSLGLKSWGEFDTDHLRVIIDTCRRYFRNRPYDRWFSVLERVLAGTNATFYGLHPTACHLDIVPYATHHKWTGLMSHQRRALLENSTDALGLLLRESDIQLLVLNGRSVLNYFSEISDSELTPCLMPRWQLARNGLKPLIGVAYLGEVRGLGHVDLGRRVKVVGYNHNLQSSFGVTRDVVDEVASWLGSVRE